MYKVYLDNNVIVDIESGKYSTNQFLDKGGCTYYYSQAHLEELLEAVRCPKVSQRERLDLIIRLCGRNHILTGVTDIPEFYERDPMEMYKYVDLPQRQSINQMANRGNEAALLFRQRLGFSATDINNQPPENVLSLIDESMRERLGIDINRYLILTGANNGRAIYHTLLQLIDIANYWGDKKTDHSNIARLYDAAHAYFAQICDILVTNDKRMTMKVKAIYSYLGVHTKVMYADNFLKEVSSTIE